MRKARIFVNNRPAAELLELAKDHYRIVYDPSYIGSPISLTLPIAKGKFDFDSFPPFFEGLLPEGAQLESLIRQRKIDERDYFSQILAVGEDLVGNVSIRKLE